MLLLLTGVGIVTSATLPIRLPMNRELRAGLNARG